MRLDKCDGGLCFLDLPPAGLRAILPPPVTYKVCDVRKPWICRSIADAKRLANRCKGNLLESNGGDRRYAYLKRRIDECDGAEGSRETQRLKEGPGYDEGASQCHLRQLGHFCDCRTEFDQVARDIITVFVYRSPLEAGRFCPFVKPFQPKMPWHRKSR